MFEQDFVKRMIQEMVRVSMLVLFNIDMCKKEEFVNMNEDKNTGCAEYDLLCDLVDDGQINEAENRLTDIVDGKDKNMLELALRFYDYVNTKDTEFLSNNNFSREEIRDGIKAVTYIYGCESFVACFMDLIQMEKK